MLAYHSRGRFYVIFIGFSLLVCVAGTGARPAAARNHFTLPHLQITNNDTGTFGLGLENEDLATGVQVHLIYDSTIGFRITAVTLTSRTTGYEPPVVQIDHRNPREVDVLIILYALSGAAIIPGTGAIVTVHYETSADVVGSSLLLLREPRLSAITNRSLSVSGDNGMVSTDARSVVNVSGSAERAEKKALPQVPTPPGVPEPTTGVCWLLGLCLMGIYLKRRSLNDILRK